MKKCFLILLLFSCRAFAFEVGDSVVTISITEMKDGSFTYSLAKDSYVKNFSDKRYRTSAPSKWMVRAKGDREAVLEKVYFTFIDPKINEHGRKSLSNRPVKISNINLALRENLRKIEIIKNGKIIKRFLVKDLVDMRESQ